MTITSEITAKTAGRAIANFWEKLSTPQETAPGGRLYTACPHEHAQKSMLAWR